MDVSSVPDVSEAVAAIDGPLPYVWPLAGPFGALLLALMFWLTSQ
jgi:hypothetical protein